MADLVRISLTGELPNGEKWSVNPVWGLNDFPVSTTPAQITTIANGIAGLSGTVFPTIFMTPNTRWTGCRVEARTRQGVLENQAEAVRANPTSGTGTASHPFQTSMVVSLRTQAVGASGRGRLYFPATGMVLDADTLRPITTNVNLALGATKSLLTAIDGVVRTTFNTARLGVWSRKGAVINNVNGLQLGDIMDVQRRRRDALVESYSTLAYP